ncbi:hypothetical protein BGZ94_008150 [Podila epigama]|nr:hypothetical protein BGZ94_008150 [Podila epigama]
MAPSCAVDPLECILYERQSFYKRAPPSPSDVAEAPTQGTTDKTVVIVAASVGSVVLILCLALFYICMRRRRASRRIGQLAQFLPTFMDKEKTESYFKAQDSSSTLAPPPEPSSAHHRVRSAPIAFAKGVTDHRNRQLERDASMGQFQQISLISEDTLAPSLHGKDTDATGAQARRSLSLTSRNRTSSVSVVRPSTPPTVVSSLHRSVSLNKHERASPSGRNAPVPDSTYSSPENNPGEIIPGPNNTSRFAEGESIGRGFNPNRYSALLDYNLSQEMAPGEDDDDDDGVRFDPTRFSTASVMFDAKHISTLSTASSDDTVSSDEFKDLPPHQRPHSFHSHHATPISRSRVSSVDGAVTGIFEPTESSTATSSQPAFVGGEKQEILDDDDALQASARFQQQLQQRQQDSYLSSSIPDKQEYEELEPEPVVAPGMPLPPRITLSKPHGG